MRRVSMICHDVMDFVKLWINQRIIYCKKNLIKFGCQKSLNKIN